MLSSPRPLHPAAGRDRAAAHGHREHWEDWKRRLATGALAAALLATPAAAQPAPAASPYARAIAAGYKALTYCEGIFNAGRTPEQIDHDELRGIYPEYDAIVPTLEAWVDRGASGVAVPFDDALPRRRADWQPTQGCRLRPIGADDRPNQPHHGPDQWQPIPADPRPWPTGDSGVAPRPSRALAATVGSAFDRASYGEGKTVGIVVLRDGQVVAERYADGFGPFVSNRTWSVAKSIAGTLIGLNRLDVTKPVTIAAWGLYDPRAAITLDNLLRMASGLHSDTAGNRTDAIYFGGATVDQDATHWLLDAAPGTRFRYANNDILFAIRSLRETLSKGDGGTGMVLNAQIPGVLFFPLGMRHTVAEQDVNLNYILSSQVWSTARDLARLGQFWLQDGVWQGKRMLPEGWMRYMTTPSGPQPADGPGYGATMWLFGPKQGLPAGSYAAQGNRGQYVMVIPSAKLVIVRRGEDPGAARFDIAKFAADVLAATR